MRRLTLILFLILASVPVDGFAEGRHSSSLTTPEAPSESDDGINYDFAMSATGLRRLREGETHPKVYFRGPERRPENRLLPATGAWMIDDNGRERPLFPNESVGSELLGFGPGGVYVLLVVDGKQQLIPDVPTPAGACSGHGIQNGCLACQRAGGVGGAAASLGASLRPPSSTATPSQRSSNP